MVKHVVASAICKDEVTLDYLDKLRTSDEILDILVVRATCNSHCVELKRANAHDARPIRQIAL
jgi:hypothetical protein